MAGGVAPGPGIWGRGGAVDGARAVRAFAARHPVWAGLLALAAAVLSWLIFAVWPEWLEDLIGRKKVFLDALFNGITLGGLFPGGERVHARLRADARRRSGPWLALSARRLCGVFRGRCDGDVAPGHSGGLRRRGAVGGLSADRRLSADGGAGSAPDAGDDRDLHRHGGSDALGFRRGFLHHPAAGMALGAARDGARHLAAGPQFGRGGDGLPEVPDGADRDLRRLGRGERHVPIGGAGGIFGSSSPRSWWCCRRSPAIS